MLDLYQAELARLLRKHCDDIALLASGKASLSPGTEAWDQAVLLVRLYQALYRKMQGNGAMMCHWLRVSNNYLGGSPLMLMVDEGKLHHVLDYVVDEL